MLTCHFQSSVFDVVTQTNFCVCTLDTSKVYLELVNSYICRNCPLYKPGTKLLVPNAPITERRSPEEIVRLSTICSNCSWYDKTRHNCIRIYNSQTIEEQLKDAKFKCPTNQW